MEPTENKTHEPFRLKNAPIVEAVIDIDCDFPPGTDFAAIGQTAHERFKGCYPKVRMQLVQEHQIEKLGLPEASMLVRQGIQAFQFLTDDEKQLVQVRAHGFSFNRLAPYTTLGDYYPEIERAWKLFVELLKPVQVRKVGARYINRIFLPYGGGKVELEDYLKICPKLPEQERLHFVGFLNQHAAEEDVTKNRVNIILTAQKAEGDKLPLIFDIETWHDGPSTPGDWVHIQSRIESLRDLKNRVFKNTLTEKCLNQYQ